MNKTGIVIAMIVWSVMATRIIGFNHLHNDSVVEAFNELDFDNVDTVIDAIGTCKTVCITPQEKEKNLAQIASAIGIDGNYKTKQTQEGDNIITTLTKTTGNAKLVLKLTELKSQSMLSTYNTQYLSVKLTIKNRSDCALTYKKLIEEIFDTNKIEGKVTLSLEGTRPGALNIYERNTMADRLMKELKAEVVTESRDSELFTIYAYTDYINEYTKTMGKKVNINITETYDEKENKTIFRLTTPLNNLDY